MMTGLANLIMHLGGDEIPHAGLSVLVDWAEEEALLIYTSHIAPKVLHSKAALKKPSVFVEGKYSPSALDNIFPVLPPTKPKASLKPSRFFPVFADRTPPRLADFRNNEDAEDKDEPGVYSKLEEGVGDGTH